MTFPAYLGRPPLTIEQQDGDLEAPQFTMAELRDCADGADRAGLLAARRDVKMLRQGGGWGKALLAELLLKDRGAYAIHLRRRRGMRMKRHGPNQVRILSDPAPVVRIVEPGAGEGRGGGWRA